MSVITDLIDENSALHRRIAELERDLEIERNDFESLDIDAEKMKLRIAEQQAAAIELARLLKQSADEVRQLRAELAAAKETIERYETTAENCDLLRAELASIKAQEPVELDYPEYHAEGMGCGLEDRGITDRYEAMAYGFQEAVEQMATIIGSVGALYAAPVVSAEQQGVADVYPHEEMDALATTRFKVGASSWSVMPFAVRAGDGDQEIYRGSKSDCENVARKLAGAFLDGGIALIAMLAADPAPSSGVVIGGLDVAKDRFEVELLDEGHVNG